MFRHFALVSVLVGGLATAGAASAPHDGTAAAWLKGRGADTPLGRLIAGSIGPGGQAAE